MLHDELKDLVGKSPFEPFRIKLVNGDQHDIFDAGMIILQSTTVVLLFREGHWVVFEYNKIASIESLIPDFAAGAQG